jgi:hypothetical protein
MIVTSFRGRVFVVVSVVAVAVIACSEFKPGSYEGGGRTGGPITIGGAGSNCSPAGANCNNSDECCSHDCAFTGTQLICSSPTDGAPQCKANNSGCTTGSECCSTYCSPGQLCMTAPVQDSGGGG